LLGSLTLRDRPNLRAFAGVMSATLVSFLAIGAALPVLPRYITGPLGGGDVAVGIVAGAFAFTAIISRPFGGRLADRRGRKPVALVGMCLAALAGVLYYLPFDVYGLILSRLVLGVGQGWVFTAGLAWTVDLAPIARRGQAIGYYGLGVWGGLSFGPLIGELALDAGSYELVWALTAVLPLAGAAIAATVPERSELRPAVDEDGPGGFLPREAVRPGTALFLASLGFAALAGFIVLHLEELGVGGGATVFTAFASTVVVTRLALAWLPDRIGARRAAIGAALSQAVGLTLIAVTGGLTLALAGALFLGAGFSLSFPALALAVVERVSDARRGAAMGAFTAFFDLGVGVGAPIAGAVAAIAGYPAAFGGAAGAALLGALVMLTDRTRPSPGPPRR
jgi:MFS family permease